MAFWGPGGDPGHGTRTAAWSEDSLSFPAIHSPAPRRDFQSRSGQGVGRESEGGLRTGRVATGQLPPPAPLISESPTLLFQALARSTPSCQRPPFCPFVALDQKPGGSRTELPPDRGVDVGVAVILQSSDQTVLLTRRTCTLRISPNVWVPPGEHLGTDAVGDSVLSLHIATGCQSCTVDAQGLCPQLQTSSAHWKMGSLVETTTVHYRVCSSCRWPHGS